MSTSKSLGFLSKSIEHESGIRGNTNHGNFKVTFYTESIVKISISESESFDDFSYATVLQPKKIPSLIITEADDHITLRSDKLIVKVSKSPVRFTFLTINHQLLNEDETFGTSWIGEQVTTYKKIQEGERFIGLGEKTGGLDRRGSGYQNWNTDAFAYGTSQDPLYCSIPFYMGIHHNLVYGMFLDNSHKSFFNFGASNNRFASFSADAGDMNYYFIQGNNVGEVIKNYTELTGRMEMPPLWSIGYQQCRYSYYPDKEVLNVARTFREKNIPADVIVLDIHYMQDYKIFTWSKKNFPNPKALIETLTTLGFKVIVICDPGIKVETGYQAYDDGVQQNIFLKYPDGSNYQGQVWPGWCHFPDFTNPKARDWWTEQFKTYTSLGIEGFWNDMNEIATWGNMVPENIEFDFEGDKASMRKGRNVYGMMMAKSSYESAKKLLKGKRPFNLTRSGYAGVQRYSAVWTGDNVSYDEHMILGARIISSMGLSGVSFAGYDIGGFVGEAGPKLFARWLSIGTFSPFFRGHSMINSRDAEPWAFGEEAELIARNYIRFRYQMLPYIYSLFFESTQTGLPVQRSLAIDYSHEAKIYEGPYFNQYLFGPAFLVCPVESNKDLMKIYLPEGEWYYLYNGKKYAGDSDIILECPINKLPVFVKGGSIIPMQPVVSNTSEINEQLIVHVYYGSSKNTFEYYEDDGQTFSYQEGHYHKREIEFIPDTKTLVLKKSSGSHASKIQKLKIMFHGFPELNHLKMNMNQQTLHHEMNRFFEGLEKFDPFYDPEPAPEEPVRAIEVDYTSDQILFNWD